MASAKAKISSASNGANWQRLEMSVNDIGKRAPAYQLIRYRDADKMRWPAQHNAAVLYRKFTWKTDAGTKMMESVYCKVKII